MSRRAASRKTRALGLWDRWESLESRVVLSLTIQLDYSYDSAGFFTSHPQAKTILQEAAQYLGSTIHDHLQAITSPPSSNDSWTASPFDPSNINSRLNFSNLTVPADTIIVYAGGSALGSNTLGEGGPGSYAYRGSASWGTLISTRGVAAAAATPRRAQAPWGGSVSFNTATNFSYTDINSAPGNSGPDFLSTAIHELGHVLGMVPGGNDYGYRSLPANTFNGPHAVAAYGGPVPLDSAGVHWADGTTFHGLHASLDPILPPAGQRAIFSGLDWAGLADVGWHDESVSFVTQPPSSFTVGTAFSVSIAAKYPDGTTDTTFNGPITLSIGSGPSGAGLGGLLTATAVNGVATFTNITYTGNVNGTYAIHAAPADPLYGAGDSTTSQVLTNVQATRLSVTSQTPSSVAAGSTFSFTVAAVDASGNVSTSYNSPITVTVLSNPGGASLSGPLTVTPSNGFAVFSGLSLDKIGSGYRLLVTAPGVSSVITSSIQVTQAVATISVQTYGASQIYGQPVAFGTIFSGITGLPSPTGNVQFFVDGVQLGGLISINNGVAYSPATSSLHVGTHYINVDYFGDANFGTSFSTAAVQTITPAILTVTADSQTKAYGAANPPLTATYSGFVNGDTSAVVIVAPGLSTVSSPTAPPGTYAIIPFGGSAQDYTFQYVAGTITVQYPTPVTITNVAIRTVKTGRRTTTTVIVVSLSEALDQGTAQIAANYQLVTWGRDRTFGTADDVFTNVRSASYNAVNRTVTLVPRTALRTNPPIRFRINGSGIADVFGQRVDGNHDGVPGGFGLAQLSRNQVQLFTIAKPLAIDAALASAGGVITPKKRAK